MNFAPSEDQRAFLDAVERFVDRQPAVPLVPVRFEHSAQLEHALAEAGFFECMAIEELGPVAAAMLVMELARLTTCAETVASALVAPIACPHLPRPYALLGDRDDAPARFLPVARTVMRVRDGMLQAAVIGPADVEPVDSVFAYPMGTLRVPSSVAWQLLPDFSAGRLRTLWQVGIAAELTGCLASGLRSVVQHVKDRRQFGRAIGSFQAVQHRLAACATLIEGAKWLALRAAASGGAVDAAAAAGYAQQAARKVTYDLHQFMGAMGLTLEHPLHRWTYRAKLLMSELGGAERQLAAAAVAAWTRTSA